METDLNPLQSRWEAVRYLRSIGFHADERTWAAGETILVATDPFPDSEVGLSAYRYALYICPTEHGWSIEDPEHRDAHRRDFSLREACDTAVALLNDSSRKRRALILNQHNIATSNHEYHRTQPP